MRGSPTGQMNYIFRASGIFQPGTSRHQAKASARAAGAKSPSAIAAKTGIQSFATYKAYFKTGVELLKFCREVHGIRSADQLTAVHVRTFLESKIRSGIKLSSFRRYAAGISKIESALSRVVGRECGWTDTIAIMREAAAVYLDGSQKVRAYDRPGELLEHLEGDSRIVAELQLFSGLRVSEATYITQDQLRGFSLDQETGQAVGQLFLTRTKGGKPRLALVPVEVYQRLSERLAAGEDFQLNRQQYRQELMDAAVQSGQDYRGKGSHGLRWNFAKERLNELINYYPYEVALTAVSHQLGHSRGSITSHYLRD